MERRLESYVDLVGGCNAHFQYFNSAGLGLSATVSILCYRHRFINFVVVITCFLFLSPCLRKIDIHSIFVCVLYTCMYFHLCGYIYMCAHRGQRWISGEFLDSFLL